MMGSILLHFIFPRCTFLRFGIVHVEKMRVVGVMYVCLFGTTLVGNLGDVEEGRWWHWR